MWKWATRQTIAPKAAGFARLPPALASSVDAIVFVPQDRIVYLSEVFFDGRFPFMNDGYVDWIGTIDAALKLDADIFVPGQGPSAIASNPRGSREALMRALGEEL